jgi:hypothetical protein
MFLSSYKAQALIEYIFILAFIGFVAVTMMRGFGQSFSNSMGSLNFFLTQELSTGVCNKACMGNQYVNFVRAEE